MVSQINWRPSSVQNWIVINIIAHSPSMLMSQIITTAFFSANCIASCRPTPPAPPVMRTTWLATFYEEEEGKLILLLVLLKLSEPWEQIPQLENKTQAHLDVNHKQHFSSLSSCLSGRRGQIDFAATQRFLPDPILSFLEVPLRLSYGTNFEVLEEEAAQ